MNKKLSGILSMILSIIILLYFESFIYKLFNVINININNYSNLIQLIINLVIKLIMCILIYIIYKKDFRNRRGKDNILKTIVIFLISLVSIVIGIYLFNKIVKYIGGIFKVDVLNTTFYNIFNKKLDLNLILKIINDYIIIPYLYCSIIILSIDKFFRRNDTYIIFSGLLASIVYGISLSGTLGFVIVNSLSTFLLFSIFAFIYRKCTSIWFIITLYSFYLISNVFIINYIRW